MEMWKNRIKTFGAYLSPILFVGSAIADFLDTANAFSQILIPVMIVSSIAVLGYAVYAVRHERHFNSLKKENRLLKENISYLESEICEGMRFNLNNAYILFDIAEKCYVFRFIKKFILLTENIKWFPAQFYCNKILKDSEEARQFYSQNPISWQDLKFYAQLKYKNKGDEEFSNTYKLKVLLVADGEHFKQFNIQYKTEDNDELDIQKDAEIELEYGYSVPIYYWGSYLNRTVSYFAEESNIIVECRSKKSIQNSNMKLFKLDPKNGAPKFIREIEHSFDKPRDNFVSKIMLEPGKCSKYRLWWDANVIYSEKNVTTENTLDHTQLTKY